MRLWRSTVAEYEGSQNTLNRFASFLPVENKSKDINGTHKECYFYDRLQDAILQAWG